MLIMRGFDDISPEAVDEWSVHNISGDGCGSGGCSKKKQPARECGCKSGCGKHNIRTGMDSSGL